MKYYLDKLKGLVNSPGAVHVPLIVLLLISYLFLPRLGVFNFDDFDLIVNNPTIREWSQLPAVLASGRPVRGLTLMIDYHLFGLDPIGYHWVNTWWHYAGCIIFYLLALSLTGRVKTATIAAVLFAVMPVHSETIMNIAHRKEMLAFTFLVLAYHAWIYRKRRPIPAMIFTALFFLLGVLSKQVVLAFPLLIILDGLLDGSLKKSPRLIAATVILLGTALALLLAGTFIAGPVLRDFDLFGLVKPLDLTKITYSQVLATAMSVFPQHLQYMLFPLALRPHHLVEPVTFAAPAALAGTALFLALAASVWLTRKDRMVSLSLGWIFINLLPIMNWIPSNAFVAERYLYIPSAGACLLLAVLIERLDLSTRPTASPAVQRTISTVILAAIVASILCSSLLYRLDLFFPPLLTPYFDRGLALLTATAVITPVSVGLILLTERGKAGSWVQKKIWRQFLFMYLICALSLIAMPIIMESLIHHRLGMPELKLTEAWQNMRNFLASHGDIVRDENSLLFLSGNARADLINLFLLSFVFFAILLTVFRRLGNQFSRSLPNRRLAFEITAVIMVVYTSSLSLNNLRWSDELTLWSYTTSVEPWSAVAWNNLGKAYYGRGRFADAAVAYKKGIEIWPDRWENYRNLGICYVKTDQLDQAREAFEKALDLNPYDVVSLINLANVYFIQALDQDDPAAFNPAIKGYLRVLEIDPRSAHAHYNLAYCYYRIRKLDLALEHVNKALIIDPRTPRGQELRQGIIDKMRETRRPGP